MCAIRPMSSSSPSHTQRHSCSTTCMRCVAANADVLKLWLSTSTESWRDYLDRRISQGSETLHECPLRTVGVSAWGNLDGRRARARWWRRTLCTKPITIGHGIQFCIEKTQWWSFFILIIKSDKQGRGKGMYLPQTLANRRFI